MCLLVVLIWITCRSNWRTGGPLLEDTQLILIHLYAAIMREMYKYQMYKYQGWRVDVITVVCGNLGGQMLQPTCC